MMFNWLKGFFSWLNALFQTNTHSSAKDSSSQASATSTTRYDFQLDWKPIEHTAPQAPLSKLSSGKSTSKPNIANGDHFPWPSTQAKGGAGNLSKDVFVNKHGVLSTYGYQVGANGLPLDPRRRILDDVFLKPLPALANSAYLVEWGTPASAKRLQKLAESIAAFVRNAKRRNGANMGKSIRDWESDLAYLKRRYYDNRFSFPWPPTTIDKA